MNGDFIKGPKVIGELLYRNAPAILSGLAVVGVAATVITSGKAAIKAKELKDEMPKDTPIEEQVKHYAWVFSPAAVTAFFTMACIIMSHHISAGRYAAARAAYVLYKKKYGDLEDTAKDVIGEKNYKKIKDAMAFKDVENNPVESCKIYNDSDDPGLALCFDTYSGRYFKARIEEIEKAFNEINKICLDDGFVPLNDYYEKLDLPPVKNGEEIGWNISYEGLVNPSYSSQLDHNNTPIRVVDFDIQPKNYLGEY